MKTCFDVNDYLQNNKGIADMLRKFLVFLVLLSLHSAGFAQSDSQFGKFSFLIGNWSYAGQKETIIEKWEWSKKSGLNGISYSINHSGDSVLLETISIHKEGNEIYYTPTGHQPGNTSTVPFKLVSDKEDTYIFENRNHDFPQRIVYRKLSDSELLAWIEGTINGKLKKIEFPYKKQVD